MQVAVEAVLVPAERKRRDGNGDTDVDAHHPAIGAATELAGVLAVHGEDRGTVGELARVHLLEPLLEVLHPLDGCERRAPVGHAPVGCDCAVEGERRILKQTCICIVLGIRPGMINKRPVIL